MGKNPYDSASEYDYDYPELVPVVLDEDINDTQVELEYLTQQVHSAHTALEQQYRDLSRKTVKRFVVTFAVCFIAGFCIRFLIRVGQETESP